MKKRSFLTVLCLILGWSCALSAAPAIVEDGKPKSQIVVAEKAPRMVKFAALELQYYIQKISGARLPIVTKSAGKYPVSIYVGKSAGTERLGVKDDGLKYGAYRMVSGPEWIVLLGEDYDFQHPLPWPDKRNDVERADAEWDKMIKGKTDTGWGFPFRAGFKAYWNPGDFEKLISTRYGNDAVPFWKGGKESIEGFWEYDGAGTLNAVYAFLRSFGVRWFMPGELGEVVPKTATLNLPQLNETVKPQFALRDWNYYTYSGFSFDDVIYARRSGMNSGYEKIGLVHGPHGLTNVTRSEALKKAHPEYYALIGGKRDMEHRGSGTACFSSEGLMKETAKYIQFMYDKYNMPLVDVWPADGFKHCTCESCKGKTASELVWGFADRVAREVYKTHPNKLVSCGAYTSYVDAPDSIAKFSPNLVVQISNCSRPLMEDPERWLKYQERLDKWKSKIAPGNIMRLENNRYFVQDVPAVIFPVIHPRAIAKDLKYLKGISFGDTGEQSQAKQKWCSPGLNHINLYVQSQLLWNPDQDLDALLEDYYKQFYGPAAAQMKEAFTFAEDNLAYKDQSKNGGRANPANVPVEVSIRFRELIDKARKAAGDTVYGKRIDVILSELVPKDKLVSQIKEDETALAKARAKAPLVIGVNGADLRKAAAYKLKDNFTGAIPAVETSFQVGWEKNAVIFDILCKEPDIKKMPVSPTVHGGDYVTVLLATPKHNYYYIEVNPDGAIVEGDPGLRWKSLAEIKTERGADFWRVRMRIPVVGDEEANADPNHHMAGDKPAAKNPWFFNVGRYRKLKDGGVELQTFSPTKRNNWHLPEKFAKLEIK